jgi:hypothetical protein
VENSVENVQNPMAAGILPGDSPVMKRFAQEHFLEKTKSLPGKGGKSSFGQENT